MTRLAAIVLAVLSLSHLAQACGLDWTLPQAHFEGVDEHGYVAYWEKIGQADLGDGLVIPVNIGFNSHRETSSPTLGKGWILPLLESHVEPVDENSMNVIMPDGWIFTFLRNGNTETWRGNAGWVGETDGARFTITAPCGWRVKFDTGKIQEIDTPKDRTITIKYNGAAPTEADIDTKSFLQVDPNPATGVPQDILIGDQKINLSQAQRPRISTILGKTLLTGFDPSLSQLQYPDGKKETFNFTAPQDLTPTLAITQPTQPPRNFTWDANTKIIRRDQQWSYLVENQEKETSIRRVEVDGKQEFYSICPSTGKEVEETEAGERTTTTWFVSGPLRGDIRKVILSTNGVTGEIDNFDYDDKGSLIRKTIHVLINGETWNESFQKGPRGYEFKATGPKQDEVHHLNTDSEGNITTID